MSFRGRGGGRGGGGRGGGGGFGRKYSPPACVKFAITNEHLFNYLLQVEVVVDAVVEVDLVVAVDLVENSKQDHPIV